MLRLCPAHVPSRPIASRSRHEKPEVLFESSNINAQVLPGDSGLGSQRAKRAVVEVIFQSAHPHPHSPRPSGFSGLGKSRLGVSESPGRLV